MRQRARWFPIGIAVLIFACGGRGADQAEPAIEIEAPAAASEVLSVYAVNYPLAYFARRLGGEAVQVTLPVPAGVDPAYWQPGPEDIVGFQQADLVLLNGADYAKWLELVSLPVAGLVNTAVAFHERWVTLEQGSVHSHGLEGEHSHQGYAFTTWLDPELAIEQAEAIAAALIEKSPSSEAEVRRRLSAVTDDWREIDRQLAAATAEIGDRPVLFSHPVYQYLERRYGLNGRSLHWEPDQMPTATEWQELEALLEEHPARWMLWEGRPLPEIDRRLVDLGITSLVFDPCGNVPEAGDLLSVMRRNASMLDRIDASE